MLKTLRKSTSAMSPFLVVALLIGGCIHSESLQEEAAIDLAASVEARELETKMISSGNNAPPIRLREANRTEVLTLLHERVPEAEIRDLIFSDGSDGGTAIDGLMEHGFVESASGTLRPTLTVMTLDSVAEHMKVREEVAAAAFEALASYAPKAMETARTIPGLENLHPEAYSLYILSDVLLDTPQINFVEQQFLGVPRPERAGGRYYLSIQEKPAGETGEAFGIFGNHIGQYDGVLVGVYGNNRNADTDFHVLENEYLWPAGVPAAVTAEMTRERRTALARSFVDAAGGAPVGENEKAALISLGWLTEEGTPDIPIVTSADQAVLPELLGGFTSTLVGILNKERAFLEAEYRASPYSDEISFEEYFIWWYHLFYTDVTERLIAADLVHLPTSNVVTYVFVP